LYSEFESQTTIIYDDQYRVILPTLDIPGLKERYEGYQLVTEDIYSSSDVLMNKSQIREMLVKGRFLP
ncbi:MAG: UDP-N-acetylglucosamine 4,6-dehydratase, partial [Gorillibacterium sp.]|nr:UDP-N-acetylglucosamine 4,6-dehydratase [Gorillibacterium sp.]